MTQRRRPAARGDRDGECRVRVWFRGHPPLYYRAARKSAELFASAVRPFGVEVVVDAKLSEGLRPLPCARLWAL